MPCLKRKREKVCPFFLPQSPTKLLHGSNGVFLKVEYPRKVNQVGTPKWVKNMHPPSLTFLLLSEGQGFILPQVPAWITPPCCCFFPFSIFPYHVPFPHSHSEVAHPASLPAETVSSGGLATHLGAFCRLHCGDNHPFVQQEFSCLSGRSFGISCAQKQVKPSDWQCNFQHHDVFFSPGLVLLSFVHN